MRAVQRHLKDQPHQFYTSKLQNYYIPYIKSRSEKQSAGHALDSIRTVLKQMNKMDTAEPELSPTMQRIH